MDYMNIYDNNANWKQEPLENLFVYMYIHTYFSSTCVLCLAVEKKNQLKSSWYEIGWKICCYGFEITYVTMITDTMEYVDRYHDFIFILIQSIMIILIERFSWKNTAGVAT